MPDVLASDSAKIFAKISQHRQRSVVSIPSVAGQPSGSGGDGSQNRAGCATVASIRRKADRYDTTRVFGPNTLLDDC
jgi:hypothetical protein